MMDNQRHLFQLPADATYLNCAYMSPMLRSVEDAAMEGLLKKRYPALVTRDDYFNDAAIIRSHFAQLINGSPEAVAIIPSASYGIATVLRNISDNGRKKAITIQDEFPSGYLSIDRWCRDAGIELQVIGPDQNAARTDSWNHNILQAINTDTALVLLSSVHWMDGTLFDLPAIGQRCRETGTRLVIDGTQSVGALPFDVQSVPCDALICAGYKWLLGPYGIGVMWVHPSLHHGIPLEESWMNRSNAKDFANLTKYSMEYQPGAGRYNAGEHGNFLLLPMFRKAIEQIIAWTPEAIQEHSKGLSTALQQILPGAIGDGMAGHLFGIRLQPSENPATILEKLQQERISVSLRGDFLRISPHVYNTEADILKLVSGIGESISVEMN